MTNILEAICNIYENRNFNIRDFYSGRIRINGIGDALENYIKDAFANTFDESNQQERLRKFRDNFSWLGVQNHPPDIMIEGGDAIEVKKSQSARSNIPLNSSYPKADISSDSPMITEDCRNCEEWTRKDLIYAMGHTTDNSLKTLWLIYGNIYAAKHEIYQRVKNRITDGIRLIPNVELTPTKELSKVKRVDPLGITNLRVRGMWDIQHPKRVFEYVCPSIDSSFELVSIIPLDKYDSFEESSKDRIEAIESNEFSINDIEVQNPNNPAQLIDCKIIRWLVQE